MTVMLSNKSICLIKMYWRYLQSTLHTLTPPSTRLAVYLVL